MENAIRAARKGVEADKYKAIFLDDYNLFASALQVELAKKMAGASGNSDGRAVWWEYRKRVLNICHRLMDVKAHFVMACHPGSFLGKAGNDIPGVFDDVVWMTKNNKGERIFQINGDTEPGRGSRFHRGRAQDRGRRRRLLETRANEVRGAASSESTGSESGVEVTAAEWNIVVRCKGATSTLLSLYGSEKDLVVRSQLALSWGDTVEYLGPRIDATSWLRRTQSKDGFASISDLKDTLKRRRNSSQENLQ